MNAQKYVVLYRQQAHPLANSRGELFEHRAVLYEAIGPGTHPCHFCGKPVTWRKRGRGEGPRADDLQPEHLDGDGLNNDPQNLVPSCQSCNVTSGYKPNRIRDDEPFILGSRGRTRAVEATCLACGRAFLAAPSSHQVFCSTACADDAKRLEETCRRGHPRTSENLYYYKGTRRCRACMLLASKAYLTRKKS